MTDAPTGSAGTVCIHGSSDNLVKVRGEIVTEWSDTFGPDPFLSLGDGTILKMWYDDRGRWNIDVIAEGEGSDVTHYSVGSGPEGARVPAHSESVEIRVTNSIRWVAKDGDLRWAPD